MTRVTIKKDDLLPNIRATLTDADGSAIDLTLASGVRFVMKKPGATTSKVNASASVVTPGSGVVQYTWSGTDTNTSGVYYAEFEVNWGGGVYQTFPASGYLEVEIVPDLGGSV
jgi:hypothetical protein